MTDIKLQVTKFLSKLLNLFRERSIRSQIIIVLSLSLGVFMFVFILSTGIYRKSISTVENSYKTNADLDKYLTLLTETQDAFQSYMQYRTFESIDKYYHYLALSEETTEMPQAVQLIQPKEAIDNMAEIERQYRETIERENR